MRHSVYVPLQQHTDHGSRGNNVSNSKTLQSSRGADPGGAGGAAAPPILILVVQTYHFAPPIIPVHK